VEILFAKAKRLERKARSLTRKSLSYRKSCEVPRIGNAFADKRVDTMEVKGRDAISGLPRTLELDSNEIRKALKEPTDEILDGIKSVLERTPPELAADIVERGIVLTGGGCLLRGLEHYLTKETGVPVFRAENPLTCVVLGTGRYLDELKYIKPGIR